MSAALAFELARAGDARVIAGMSRDLVEAGLAWSWTPSRVARHLACKDTSVLVARVGPNVVGFAIMHFQDQVAHLNLLAVAPAHRRTGIGRGLIEWLETSGRIAGVLMVNLELRAGNRAARAFYRALRYREVAVIPGYYDGREPAIRMSHYLPEQVHLLPR